MKVTLTRTWELSDEHAMSRAGQPVLVHRGTGAASGPGDPVEASPLWGVLPAARLVARMVKTVRLNARDMTLVTRFIESLPPEASGASDGLLR